ncbi:hypothetical protein, partial [Vibrio parahaemolyticus]|uniref:hypothetical protein n=1 Tax=Vibrio parahaemolyticus TaxID=670 RepID=UPI0019D6C213
MNFFFPNPFHPKKKMKKKYQRPLSLKKRGKKKKKPPPALHVGGKKIQTKVIPNPYLVFSSPASLGWHKPKRHSSAWGAGAILLSTKQPTRPTPPLQQAQTDKI